MRRPALIAWPLICYFCFALTVVAKDNSDNDNVRLRVSIRKDTLKSVPSCQHTFSQVELLNLHPTEPIMIHSIQTAPEETVLIRSAGDSVGKIWEDDVIPQQLHVSRLPQGSLSLGPGQVAIVPVTFLPRYPDLTNVNTSDSPSDSKPLPSLSSTARVDLVELVGESVLDKRQYAHLLDASSPSKRRNNLDPSRLPKGDEFEVTTTVVVDTSRGVLKLPISATSIRQNAYAIPDVVHFHHSEIKKTADDIPGAKFERAGVGHPASSSEASISPDAVVLIDTIHADDSGDSRATLKTTKPERDCFDVYLSNPLPDKELEISEVLISKPEHMSVEFDPGRLLLAPDLVVLGTKPSQVIREWTEEGPMYLPPDSDDNYVATICTAPNGVERDESTGVYLEEMANWIDSGSPDRSLGFLQIRTDTETLFVALERREDTSVSFPIIDSQLASTKKVEHSSPSPSALLRAVPDRLDFHLMSSASPALVSKIGLQNKSPVPIRIMRLTVGMDTHGDTQKLQSLRRIGLDLKASFGSMVSDEDNLGDQLDSFILGAANTVGDALTVRCGATSDFSLVALNQESFHFTGTIVLRGTMDTELRYDEWREEMIKDPYRDAHLTLEIPYSISVSNGRVEVIIERSTHPYPQIFGPQPWDRSGRAISGLFFPLTEFEALEGSENPLPTQKYQNSQEIGHDLRIMSNMAVPLKLEGAEIVDENGRKLVSDSLCGRFNVTLSSPFETSTRYANFEELGFVSLNYRFAGGKNKAGEKKKRGSDQGDADTMYPTSCYLNIITSPADTGVHRTPLIIFPGQLEISSPKNHAGDDDEISTSDKDGATKSPKQTASSFMGFAPLLAWFRSSVVGKSLLEVFATIVEDKKSFRNDQHLLVNYLLKLCHRSHNMEKSKLKPILLKIGAVEHGEIARAPLFFTNHNPVPITVTIDVGEVEGMNIALGRDASQGRGDGNNILDYLPKQSVDSQYLINDGKHQGHPMNGLRQFLVSNQAALSFSSRFPFRDAVSLSPAAVAKQPLLQSLYRWHSYAEFHREPLPGRFKPTLSTVCDLSRHPPRYKSFGTAYKPSKHQRLPGPFLISADKKLARPLTICWERDMEDPSLSEGTKVLIPPGGTARFEVRVRAPPQSYLQNDISQLLSTGLVLSTNFGQVMPIFATFEALQGQLHVSKVGTPALRQDDLHDNTTASIESGNVTVIGVPMGLFWQPTGIKGGSDDVALSIPPARGNLTEIKKPPIDARGHGPDGGQPGVSLHVTSSFSREVRLVKIESCNPWFQVLLRDPNERLELSLDSGINVGSLHSTVSCVASEDSDYLYPSYYQCALNWLSNRSDLQPPGCGLLRVLNKRKSDDEGGVDTSRRGVKSVIQAFRNALTLSQNSNSNDVVALNSDINATQHQNPFISHSRGLVAIKSGRKRSDGFITPSVLGVFAEAWDAWRIAADYGLTTLSSNLRATIEYDTFGGEAGGQESGDVQQSLSLSMQNLAVESILSTPRLFDAERVNSFGQSDVSQVAEENPSMIEFPPTSVGSIVSIKIPLRNPTSVPVRVRIGVATPIVESDKESDRVNVDDTLEKRYLRNLGSPFVQNGRAAIVKNESAQHLWWDGGGAFFVSDERGDIVRSHHNITIRAGAGAHVSLVNPSLHSNVAFVVGCGVRCGVRDDPQASKSTEHMVDPKMTSPIGAAAAAGITLAGRQRWNLPQANAMAIDEPHILAGGTPVPGSGGPSAFAIPYSALDEQIIPPFGVAEIGPIFFRPPGRFGVLGCDVAKESEASHWGVKTAELCESQTFESMIFLENSLTGLERVVLRGKSLWERLYFADPVPNEGDDAFGDIEFRNGRPTLIFPGSSLVTNLKAGLSRNGRRQTQPVVKEVVLHNGGDVTMEVGALYFADSSKVLDKKWPSIGVLSNACTFGSFRLLDCWESKKPIYKIEGEVIQNMHPGFKLMPGENRSLLVEHIPDCARQEEFISLNAEYRREAQSLRSVQFPDNDMLSLSRSGEVRNSKSSQRTKSFQKGKIDLIIGYQMNDEEFAKCAPVTKRAKTAMLANEIVSFSEDSQSKRGINETIVYRRDYSSSKTASFSTWFRKGLSFLFYFALIAAASLLMMFSWQSRNCAVGNIQAKFPGSSTQGEQHKLFTTKRRIGHSSLRNAAFRCLARADPTSTELQTLGREQIRQVVVGRYRAKGAVPPPSLSSSGAFSRDRIGVGSNSSRQRTGKEGGTATNERIRTLSDFIFHKFSAEEPATCRALLPAGVGWRTAFTRGFIDDSSIKASPLSLRTKKLLHDRRAAVQEPKYETKTEQEPTHPETSAPGANHGSDTAGWKKELVKEHEPVKAPEERVTTAPQVNMAPSAVAADSNREDPARVSEDKSRTHDQSSQEAEMDGFALVEKNQTTKIRDTEGKEHLAKRNGKRAEVDKPVPKAKNTPAVKHSPVSSAKATGLSGRPESAEAQNLSQKAPGREKGKTQNSQKNRGQRDAPAKPISNDNVSQTRKQKANKPEKPKPTSKAAGKPTATGPSAKKATKTKPESSKKSRSQIKSEKKAASTPSQAAPPNKKAAENKETKSELSIFSNPPFRPPPGLAPPPGFGSSLNVSLPIITGGDTSLGNMLTAALSNTDLKLPTSSPAGVGLPFPPISAGRGDLLFTGNFGEATTSLPDAASAPAVPGELSFPVQSSPNALAGLASSSGGIGRSSGYDEQGPSSSSLAPMDTHVLLLEDPISNGENGFDVMDFLDSILEDGISTEQTELDLSQQQDPGVLLPESSDVPLLLNPWASERKSRAAAYGISFDEVDDMSSEASPVLNVRAATPTGDGPGLGSNIPLLTPAALLLSRQEDDGKKAQSFYASLLGEE